MRATHTFAILEVSQSTFEDVAARIRAAYGTDQLSSDHYLDHTCGETGSQLIVLGEVALRAVRTDVAVLPPKSTETNGERLPKYARIGQGGSVLRLIGGNTYYRDAGHWSLHARMCRGLLCFFGTGDMKHVKRIEVVEATEHEWRDDNAGYLPEGEHNAGKSS